MSIALFHATSKAIKPVVEELRQQAPEMALLQYMDEGLLEMANEEGLGESCYQRLRNWICLSYQDGAEAILLTCSMFTPFVERLRQEAPLPVIGIDEAMFDHAVSLGGRIEIIATIESAAKTTSTQLKERGNQAGVKLDLKATFVPQAFEDLNAGRSERHDERVREAIRNGIQDADAIILAQASMAHLAADFSEYKIPILSSPRLAVERLLSLSKPAEAQ